MKNNILKLAILMFCISSCNDKEKQNIVDNVCKEMNIQNTPKVKRLVKLVDETSFMDVVKSAEYIISREDYQKLRTEIISKSKYPKQLDDSTLLRLFSKIKKEELIERSKYNYLKDQPIITYSIYSNYSCRIYRSTGYSRSKYISLYKDSIMFISIISI
jgi:hypothetical protein